MAEDLNTRVSISENSIQDLKEAVDNVGNKLDRFEESSRKDFTEADKRLNETIIIQQNQQKDIATLTDSITKLTSNIAEISKVTFELDGTKKTLDILTEDVKDIRKRLGHYQDSLKGLEDKQRTENELRKERMKLKYGLIGTMVAALGSIIGLIITSVM